MMNALRLSEGFDASLFESRTGLNFKELDQFLAAGVSRGLIIAATENQVTKTELGQRLLNFPAGQPAGRQDL